MIRREFGEFTLFTGDTCKEQGRGGTARHREKWPGDFLFCFQHCFDHSQSSVPDRESRGIIFSGDGGEQVALNAVTENQLLARFWQQLRCNYCLSIIRHGRTTRGSVVPAHCPPSQGKNTLNLGPPSHTSTRNDRRAGATRARSGMK
jgi:hypothetical protein